MGYLTTLFLVFLSFPLMAFEEDFSIFDADGKVQWSPCAPKAVLGRGELSLEEKKAYVAERCKARVKRDPENYHYDGETLWERCQKILLEGAADASWD